MVLKLKKTGWENNIESKKNIYIKKNVLESQTDNHFSSFPRPGERRTRGGERWGGRGGEGKTVTDVDI